MSHLRCPYCDSSAVIHDQLHGEQICTRCGLVLVEKQVAPGPDWHVEPGEEVGRADVTSGLDITQHDWGLGTKLGASDDLSPSWRARLRRLQKWHRRARAGTYGQRSLREALIDLDKLCEDLALPKGIKAEISSLYRRAKAGKLTVGRNTWSVLATLSFIASRIRRVPRTEREVARALSLRSGLSEKNAIREIRVLMKTLPRALKLQVPHPEPEEYIDRFGTKLGLSKKVVARAHNLCSMLPNRIKHARATFLLSATIVYLAANELGVKLTTCEMAKALDVGASSLSKTAKLIRRFTSVRGG